ncbi:EpsG family protein [Liquorilactobacillus satsumensis]|nr:EpsG family protein [Liquorilactobacillus satsumensis]MCC7667114.1 hypothetical protein [Liquorilactobacillus satsumensis]MCP9328132.1 EpsG family protein [Liquorilactobacillus satsumensis]MCP9358227.1 EpsG family protein [Liquorilactobacillus satsumensis]MCP9372181.1 EpsG family protein [Liquorilactobacillus satsumensis]
MPFIMFLINPILWLLSMIESFCKSSRSSKWGVIVATAMVFFFLGYSIELTNANADLGQYFSWFPNYENANYSYLWDEAVSEKNIFVLQQFMLAFFGKLHNNNLFTGFIVTVFYLCYMYIVTTYLQRTRWQGIHSVKKEAAIIFGLLIISFGWVLTSVRNPMANALLAVAIFRDLDLHKNGAVTLLFYVMALSMHVAVLPIIICRVLVGIFSSRSLWRCVLSVLAGGVLICVALYSNVTSTTSDKISTYGFGSSGGGFAGYARSSFYYQVNSLFLLLLMLLTLVLITILKRQQAPLDRTFRRFLTTVSALAILSYFSPTPLIDRYGMFVEIFMPLLIVNINFRRITEKFRTSFAVGLIMIGIFGFLWQIAFLSFQINIAGLMVAIAKSWFSLL